MWTNDHEEADNRMCLHVDDALNVGTFIVLARTVDKDLVVLLFGAFLNLVQDHPGIQLWSAMAQEGISTTTSIQSAKNMRKSFSMPSRVLM